MIPLDIAFRHADPSDFRVQLIRDQLEKLENVFTRIVRCHVVVEGPPRHHQHGAPYRVKVQLNVPGTQLVVDHVSHSVLTAAIREAFRAMRRQLVTFSESLHEHRPAERVHEPTA